VALAEGRETIEYYSYLLRFWQVTEEGRPAWRFSVEDPVSGERTGFANLGELVSYLIRLTCNVDPVEDA